MMARGPGGGGPMRGGLGAMVPPARAKDLRSTLEQLIGRLRLEWGRIATAVALASTGVAFTVIGPRIIGNATNVIFNGVVARRCPPGCPRRRQSGFCRVMARGSSRPCSPG